MSYDWSQARAMAEAAIDAYAAPSPVTIGSAQYPCTQGAMRREAAQERWGRDNTYRLTLTVKRALLSAVPTVRTTVTYGGVSYRILDITDNALTGQTQLHLGDA